MRNQGREFPRAQRKGSRITITRNRDCRSTGDANPKGSTFTAGSGEGRAPPLAFRRLNDPGAKSLVPSARTHISPAWEGKTGAPT